MWVRARIRGSRVRARVKVRVRVRGMVGPVVLIVI